MIRKAGNRYQVVRKDGKVLGTHDTLKEAEAQVAEIELAKKKAKTNKGY